MLTGLVSFLRSCKRRCTVRLLKNGRQDMMLWLRTTSTQLIVRWVLCSPERCQWRGHHCPPQRHLRRLPRHRPVPRGVWSLPMVPLWRPPFSPVTPPRPLLTSCSWSRRSCIWVLRPPVSTCPPSPSRCTRGRGPWLRTTTSSTGSPSASPTIIR